MQDGLNNHFSHSLSFRFALIFYANAWGKKIYDARASSTARLGGSVSTRVNALSGSDATRVDIRRAVFGGVFSQLLIVPLMVAPIERVKVLIQTETPFRHKVGSMKSIVTDKHILKKMKHTFAGSALLPLLLDPQPRPSEPLARHSPHLLQGDTLIRNIFHHIRNSAHETHAQSRRATSSTDLWRSRRRRRPLERRSGRCGRLGSRHPG